MLVFHLSCFSTHTVKYRVFVRLCLSLTHFTNVLFLGGFECYIEADDGNSDEGEDSYKDAGGGDDGAAGSAAADEYNEDDDTELLSISASNNTLSLVFRDPGTMRFVKYVSYSAPSSRYDICMEYQVPPLPPDEEDDGEYDEQDPDVGF